ncbi:MAG TPA: DnaJ domain-containing protein [Polyangiaceae bacterium]|nr:DnaJ domain-containing protein [Polyangiaceae bacterium]
MLSRVDGATSESELGALTGFDADAVRAIVDRLEALGAIACERSSGGSEGVRPPTGEQPTREPTRVSQTQVKRIKYDPRDLEEVVDLDLERKGKVLELFAQIGQLDYYALLGVSEMAEKKDIKRAYYSVGPDFHPDRFYGKKLGSFKAKMEAVFAQLTFAYETLSSAERRAEYDSYLSTQKQTRSMEKLLESATIVSAAPVAVPAAPHVDPATASPPQPPTAPRQSLAPPVDPDRARRDALARKLGIARPSLPPPEARRATPPPTPPHHEVAAQDLKRRHEAMVGESRKSQIGRYVDAGKASLTTNPAAAANAFKLALTLDPKNEEVIRLHQEAGAVAAATLAEGYLKQGDYESRMGQWLEATRSYVRAANGMPNDAAVLQKAANALLRSSGDMHQAVDLAKRAIALTPKRLEPRLTLAELYMAANLPLAAKRELEGARQISPRDDRITELSKRLK